MSVLVNENDMMNLFNSLMGDGVKNVEIIDPFEQIEVPAPAPQKPQEAKQEPPTPAKKQEKKLEGAELEKALAEKIEEFKKLDGVTAELVGSWIWLAGETKKHAKELKSLGCRWAPKKMKWSFHFGGGWYKKGHEKDYEEIKAKYGVQSLF